MVKAYETSPVTQSAQLRQHVPLSEWELVKLVPESKAINLVNDPLQFADQILPFNYLHGSVVDVTQKNGQLKSAHLRGIASTANETCYTQVLVIFPGFLKRLWANKTGGEPNATVNIGNYDIKSIDNLG